MSNFVARDDPEADRALVEEMPTSCADARRALSEKWKPSPVSGTAGMHYIDRRKRNLG
jgi:hypothetical protein